MKVSQCSVWSSEPWQNLQQLSSTTNRPIRSNNDAWIEENGEQRKTNPNKTWTLCSLFYGILLGSLLCSIALAIILTLWLTSTTSTISPSSSVTTTILTSVTTIPSTQSTTLTQSTTISTTITTVSTIITTTTTMIPPNLLINPGAEDGVLVPWITGGAGNATIDNGAANTGCNSHSGIKQFFGGRTGNGANNSTLTQSILLLNGTQGYTEAQLDNGSLSAYISFYQQSWSNYPNLDKAQISLTFRTLNKTQISTTTMSPSSCMTSWCLQSFSYLLPVGTRYIDYTMIFTKDQGVQIDSYVDDNSLKVY
ncbi:unnamed protein product [Rotaria sp. Silwood1]|nr:unnamed protein product [Rotaria sp. Silwood1]CAF4572379.1 unnamed protein product [Rotaria sp. Silwood1]